MSDSFMMPDDWDNAAGWETYYAHLSRTEISSARKDFGSISCRNAAELIGEMRANHCKSIWFPGCGVSLLPKVMVAFGFAVHATDISQSATRAQKNAKAGHKEVENLKSEIAKLGQPMSTAGSFTAVCHDMRDAYLPDYFDLIINQRAIQGFSRPSMEQIAVGHCSALKKGGQAIFDTMNVQGARRDSLEECLVQSGFYVPLFDSNRRLHRALEATGIPHVFILGSPMIPATGPYMDKAKREADTTILRRIFAEHRSSLQSEYEVERERAGPNPKVANLIYSTG